MSGDPRRAGGPPISTDALGLHEPDARVRSLEKEFWREVVRLVFVEAGALTQFAAGQFNRCFDRLFSQFATAAAWTIYPEVVPVLETLKRRGVILGLITNFDHRVFPLIDELELARFIDSITIPALAGAAKPDAAIFEYALARHGLAAGESVQVGDCVRDDVEGARAAGLRGVLLDREGRAGAVDAERITTLSELPRLIGLR